MGGEMVASPLVIRIACAMPRNEQSKELEDWYRRENIRIRFDESGDCVEVHTVFLDKDDKGNPINLSAPF